MPALLYIGAFIVLSCIEPRGTHLRDPTGPRCTPAPHDGQTGGRRAASSQYATGDTRSRVLTVPGPGATLALALCHAASKEVSPMGNVRTVIALAVLGIAVGLIGAGPAAAEPDFSIQPISVADPNVAPQGQPRLLAVSVGHHDTFDRVVFRFSSRAPGYSVRYVPAVTADGSGKPVPLEGSAFILVAMSSVASAQVGAPPAPQGTITPLFPMLRQVKGAGDFEGTVSFGLGLASKSGFRAFTLSADRLVVDVAIPTGGGLAATGTQIVPTVIAGLALIAAGASATRLSRTRRSSTVSAAATR